MVCSAVPRLRSTFSIATFRYRRTCAKEQARGLDQSASLQEGGYLNNLQASHLPNLLLFSSETNDIGHKSCHQNCFIPANWSFKGKLPRLQLRHHQLDKLDMVGGKTHKKNMESTHDGCALSNCLFVSIPSFGRKIPFFLVPGQRC